MAVNKDYETQAQGIIGELGRLGSVLSKARQNHAKAKVVFERAQTNVQNVHRERSITLAESDVLKNAVDPRSGKQNADWNKLLLESMLRSDTTMIEAVDAFNTAQETLFDAEVQMLEVAEMIGILKASARLLGDLMTYVADAE